MLTDWNAGTGEPSYFNFLMTNRGLRRAPVPFAQATGVLPELAHAPRVRPVTSGPQRTLPAA
jgi:hypothetical protein